MHIVDADNVIISIRIAPASNNDQYIWRYSSTKKYMEVLRSDEEKLNQEGKYYIIGK